jgi:hypothetical protein
VLDTLDTATGTVMAAFQCAVVEHCVGVVGAAYSQYSALVQYVLQNYSVSKRGINKEKDSEIAMFLTLLHYLCFSLS